MSNEGIPATNVQESATYQASAAPVGQLQTNRGLLKFVLLSIITLGIYSIVFYSGISNDVNVIASRYDGKKTMHYCLITLFNRTYYAWNCIPCLVP
ncbi:MAG: DUF4234 domain-containing protein [Oscillospiraceae bacterium]|jgi:hypothetical protein|nr:DUF4234 domain-containing protein [Oscillospiraceae bacterium]MCI1991335.1 DUF4234 domain-containing protein [Oscillospiraceae bacterium]MCI2035112.1 DUF4234 domain-containing protein [Oscillospiraceae bacterium]